jgi:hypothetical protein
MPGDHWSDYIRDHPDSERYQHYQREEDLEDEIEIQREILEQMNREIDAVERAGDAEIAGVEQRIGQRIRDIENRELYSNARSRISILDIQLQDHVRRSHGSYHSVLARERRPRPLSEEQVRAHEAHHRGDRHRVVLYAVIVDSYRTKP